MLCVGGGIIANRKDADPVGEGHEIVDDDSAAANEGAMGADVDVTAEGDAAGGGEDTEWIDAEVIADAEAFGVDDDDGGVNEDVVAAAGDAERLEIGPIEEVSVIIAHGSWEIEDSPMPPPGPLGAKESAQCHMIVAGRHHIVDGV